MAAPVICFSKELADGGRGVRFELTDGRETLPAFVVRVRGQASAFLNRCGHLSLELDWTPGHFLDAAGQRIICAAHGAVYDPGSGECLGGPCRGAGLVPVGVEEVDGAVRLTDNSRFQLVVG